MYYQRCRNKPLNEWKTSSLRPEPKFGKPSAQDAENGQLVLIHSLPVTI